MRGSVRRSLRTRTVILVGLAVFVGLTLALGLHVSRASADTSQPSGPDRVAAVYVDYTSYEWWMVSWKDNQIACAFYTDHDGLPTDNDIYTGCGETLYDKWAATAPCENIQAGGSTSSCPGYYLNYIKSSPSRRKIGVTLPPAVVWLTLEGCTPSSSTNYCLEQPILVLTGNEPLPNESISSIAGALNGEAFTCEATCELTMPVTGEDSIELDFWANSSYGDSSPAYQAQVRVAEFETEAGTHYWYVDVLSSQWTGNPTAGCAQIWGAFPPVGGPPAWLSTPKNAEDLASNIPYDYLAGHLIRQGAVDVSNCTDDGLLASGGASTCGQEAARPAVEDWQNSFDDTILKAANDAGIPAQLLKNLFSRESQFWPGMINRVTEVGLGQLTDNGADTALLWNPSFYEQFCPLVLADSVCRKGYPQLQPNEQAMLRGALVSSADAYCANCPLGLDLRQADFSVSVFAETLQANCGQVAQLIHNYLWISPGQVSSYEDLWKFTLVNYNAGSGCLSLAIEGTIDIGEELNWENLSQHLTPVCEGAKDYVEDISQ
jgi:hypothetical protein